MAEAEVLFEEAQPSDAELLVDFLAQVMTDLDPSRNGRIFDEATSQFQRYLSAG